MNVTAPFLAMALASAVAAQTPHSKSTGAGCGSPTPALRSNPPILGERIRLDLEPRMGMGALVVSAIPNSSIALGSNCFAYIAPSSASILAIQNSQRIEIKIPAQPALLGIRVALQAAFATPALTLSNGLEWTLGIRQGIFGQAPAAPHANLAKIAALGSRQWLDLGVPAPDPVYGLGTGREYTPRMAYARALGGAFLTGESGHGYVNPTTGRYIDGVWFYDLRGHRWICVKPGSHTTTLNLRLNSEGFEVDSSGDPTPVAQIGHGYEFITFDESTQKFFMQPLPNTYWQTSMPQRTQWLGSTSLPLTQIGSPWIFNTISGHWERRAVTSTVPILKHTARGMAVQYLPTLRKVWLWDTHTANRDKVWLFDTSAHTWQSVATQNSGPVISGHGVTCYDKLHDRVYYYGVSGKPGLWYYDVATRTWSGTTSVGVPPANTIYTTAFASMTYDPVADVVFFESERGGSYPQYHAYDAKTDSWAVQAALPAALRPYYLWAQSNTYYDMDLNVHVFHVSRTNNRTGRVLVYRHQK